MQIMAHANVDKAAGPSRRELLCALGTVGIGSAVFQRALAAQAQQAGTVTPEMVKQAEWIAGLNLSEEDRKTTAQALQRVLQSFQSLRQIKLDNSVAPALAFNPAPWQVHKSDQPRGSVSPIEQVAPKRPDSSETLAFMPVSELAALIRTRQVSSVELTKLYLQRLHQFDPLLH
jgi:Asp-tRNA(Asn)/Glu-tRNA(Gln) amidotransferase C subunit